LFCASFSDERPGHTGVLSSLFVIVAVRRTGRRLYVVKMSPERTEHSRMITFTTVYVCMDKASRRRSGSRSQTMKYTASAWCLFSLDGAWFLCVLAHILDQSAFSTLWPPVSRLCRPHNHTVHFLGNSLSSSRSHKTESSCTEFIRMTHSRFSR
jgi:hypothetical protein